MGEVGLQDIEWNCIHCDCHYIYILPLYIQLRNASKPIRLKMASVTSPDGNAMPNKYAEELVRTARAIVAPGKGILAADESTGTIGKRVRCNVRVWGMAMIDRRACA
jgi:hypothetical protein